MSPLFFLFFLTFIVFSQQQSIFERAVGPCIRGRCQPGHWCYFDQCIPLPDPETAHGPCIQGTCPGNTFCFRGECFPF